VTAAPDTTQRPRPRRRGIGPFSLRQLGIVAGVVAIAALGSIASTPQSDTVSADGLTRALFVCATLLAVLGTATAALLKESEPGGLAPGVDRSNQ